MRGTLQARIILLIVVGLAIGSLAQAELLLKNLGGVNNTSDEIEARAINSSGQVVFENTSLQRSWVWQNGQDTKQLYWHDNDNRYIHAYDINDNGAVVATCGSEDASAVFTDQGTKYMCSTGSVLPELAGESGYPRVQGINNSNQVCGYHDDKAVTWTYSGGAWTAVELSGSSSRAHGINNAGVMAGAAYSYSPDRATAMKSGWDSRKYLQRTVDARGFAISDASPTGTVGGAIAGFRAVDNVRTATVWTTSNPEGWQYSDDEGGVVETVLSSLNAGEESIAWGVSPDGTMIVGNSGDVAVMWEWTGSAWSDPIDLNDLLLAAGSDDFDSLDCAKDVNDDGLIVGYGTVEGERRAFALVPEPTTLGLLAIGGMLAVIRRRTSW